MARSRRHRSSGRDAAEQKEGLLHQSPLAGVELALQGVGEPRLAAGARCLEEIEARGGQLDEGPAPVGWVGAPRDEPGGLQVVDGLGHRLWADALAGGQVADARRAVAVESAKDRQAAGRRPGLGTQPTHEAPQRLAQLVSQQRTRGPLGRHGRSLEDVQANCSGNLCIVLGTNTRVNPDRYKWIALLNATLAVLLATLDGSITVIAMPDIFRGIHLDPLVPANSFYLLWMILGYLVVTSVLIVSLGRLGDMVGRVKIYRLGFVIYTVASLLLAVDWMQGRDGAIYLIGLRLVQGVGGACLLANAAAIITDAFPANQRGMALGINNIVGVSGFFIGLVLGGVLAPINWRLVFLISVPVGIFGTVWAYRSLRELSSPKAAPIDWWGNATFALGLILIMTAVTYGIRPAGGHPSAGAVCGCSALLGAGAGLPDRVCDRRAPLARSDVPSAAVPDPRVHVRHAVDLPVVARARRADVHADHLATGHLAAPARLRLHADPTVGRHLHAAADRRAAVCGAGLRLPVRPLRRAAVRHGGHAADGGWVRAAAVATDGLLLRDRSG